jgi:hypothetical protein
VVAAGIAAELCRSTLEGPGVLGFEVALNGQRLCSASGGVQGGVRVQAVTEVITSMPGWERALAQLSIGGWSQAWSGREEIALWGPPLQLLQVGDTVTLRVTGGADADPPSHREDAAQVEADSAAPRAGGGAGGRRG